MRWIVGVVLTLAAGVASAADAVRWTGDFRQACDVAAQDKRLVLLHFYSDNCGPCVRVDREVFSQPQVAQAIERYCVPVKVHVEQMPDLARRYNIQRWPTDVIVTSAGLEVYRTVSPQSPTQYLAMIEQVALHAGARPAAGGQVPVGATAATPPSPYPSPYQGGPVTGTYQSQLPTNDRNTYQSAIGPATHANLDVQRTPFGAAPGQPNSTPPDVAPTGNPVGTLAPPAQAQASPYSAVPDPAGNANFPQQGPAPQQQAAAVPSGSVYGNQPPAAGPQTSAYGPTPPTTSVAAGSAVPASYGATPDPQTPPQPVVNRYAMQTPPDYEARTPATPPAPPAATAGSPGPYSMQPPFAASAPQSAPPGVQPQMVPSNAAPPVVLDGCCVVTMLETRRLKKADPQFGAVHRGRTYLFASAAEQQKFLADPDRYAVMLSGYDPVRFAKTGELVEGKRQFGMMYQQKIYLMADEESLSQFSAEPQFYSTAAHQAMLRSETGGTQWR